MLRPAHKDLNQRVLELEKENSLLKQRIDTLEGQVLNADRESTEKLQAAAKSMGF